MKNMKSLTDNIIDSLTEKMKLRILHWFKRRAIKRKNHKAYFKLVGMIAKLEVNKRLKL